MLVVKIKDLDKLYDLSLKLEIIAYLQNLVQNDFIEHTLKEDFEVAQKNVNLILLDKQTQLLKNLRELLNQEDFAVSTKKTKRG